MNLLIAKFEFVPKLASLPCLAFSVCLLALSLSVSLNASADSASEIVTDIGILPTVNLGDGKQEAFYLIDFLSFFSGYPSSRIVFSKTETPVTIEFSLFSTDSKAWLQSDIFGLSGRTTWSGMAHPCSDKPRWNRLST